MNPMSIIMVKKSKFKKITILKMDEQTALSAAKSGQLDLVYVDGETSKAKVDNMQVLTLPTVENFIINLPTIPETKKVTRLSEIM